MYTPPPQSSQPILDSSWESAPTQSHPTTQASELEPSDPDDFVDMPVVGPDGKTGEIRFKIQAPVIFARIAYPNLNCPHLGGPVMPLVWSNSSAAS